MFYLFVNQGNDQKENQVKEQTPNLFEKALPLSQFLGFKRPSFFRYFNRSLFYIHLSFVYCFGQGCRSVGLSGRKNLNRRSKQSQANQQSNNYKGQSSVKNHISKEYFTVKFLGDSYIAGRTVYSLLKTLPTKKAIECLSLNFQETLVSNTHSP